MEDVKVNDPNDNPVPISEVKPHRYDPNKKYRWEPGAQFLLSGEEFGVILNSLRAILNTPEAQRILLVERASKLIDNSLARAVELNIVQEDNSPTKR